jgi:hypothetical protein
MVLSAEEIAFWALPWSAETVLENATVAKKNSKNVVRETVVHLTIFFTKISMLLGGLI